MDLANLAPSTRSLSRAVPARHRVVGGRTVGHVSTIHGSKRLQQPHSQLTRYYCCHVCGRARQRPVDLSSGEGGGGRRVTRMVSSSSRNGPILVLLVLATRMMGLFFMMDVAVAWVVGVGRIVPSVCVPLATPSTTTPLRFCGSRSTSSRIPVRLAVVQKPAESSMEQSWDEESGERVYILQQEPPPWVGILDKDNDSPLTSTSLTIASSQVSPSGAGTGVGFVDILLNRNAKGVTPAMIQVVEDVVANYNRNRRSPLQVRIHATSTLPQARAVVEEMTQHPPSLIIPVGGDGTLTQLLQLLWDSGMDVRTDMVGSNDNNDIDDNKIINNNTTNRSSGVVNGDDIVSTTVTPKKRRRFPPIAYIAQGTGNALGSVVGCRPPRRRGDRRRWSWWRRRPSFLGGTSQPHSVLAETLDQLLCSVESLQQDDSSTALTQNTSIDIVELPLIQVTTTTISEQQEEINKSELCFFSGVGFDSLMLQDYKDLQEWTHDERRPLRRKLWKDALSSVAGYCVALVTRTLPRCVQDQEHLIRVNVSTWNPQDTVWIDHRRGDIVRPVKQDNNNDSYEKKNTHCQEEEKENHQPHLLYQGEAGIVAVGSAPFYGGGLRLFPFARMTKDGMQLRIGRIHPLRGTMNLPQIFQGSYRDGRDDTFGCLDFMGPHFSITILNPPTGYPVQHSGDFIGTSKQIDYRMMTTMGGEEEEEDQLDPIQFVTLLPPRVIVEEEDGKGVS